MWGRTLLVPGHFDAEVYRVLRAYDRAHLLPPRHLETLVVALRRLKAERVPVRGLLADAHALGARFSANDAFYVALAGRVNGELFTRDRPLAEACAGVVAARLF